MSKIIWDSMSLSSSINEHFIESFVDIAEDFSSFSKAVSSNFYLLKPTQSKDYSVNLC